jgi:YD repeat-containing protein
VIVAAFGHLAASTATADQAGSVCRNYSTDETRKSTRATLQVKCKFDTATFQHLCHYSGGLSYDQLTQFGSIADFVGDPSKVSFFPHARTITITLPTSTSAQAYAYDGQGRLSSITTSVSTGGALLQTFTAWDAIGRPTEGHDATQTYTYGYDDAQRVFTQHSSGLPSLITLKLDANGNHASSTSVGGGGDSTTITVHSTAQVCR